MSVDSSQRPIVLVRYPPSFDATSYRKLFEHYAELAAEGRPIAWLVDFTAFNPVTASASKFRQDWLALPGHGTHASSAHAVLA